MRIIERTPIVLPNDNADFVFANVCATGRADRPYQLYILNPTIDRIINEFDDEAILALWADQYPEWAKIINPVIWRGHKAEIAPLRGYNNLNPITVKTTNQQNQFQAINWFNFGEYGIPEAVVPTFNLALRDCNYDLEFGPEAQEFVEWSEVIEINSFGKIVNKTYFLPFDPCK